MDSAVAPINKSSEGNKDAFRCLLTIDASCEGGNFIRVWIDGQTIPQFADKCAAPGRGLRRFGPVDTVYKFREAYRGQGSLLVPGHANG